MEKPSRVLHVRGLPSYTNESELLRLVQDYGTVTQILLLSGKHQAFLEMDSIESAVKVMEMMTDRNNAMIRHKLVNFQFSNHQELKPNVDSKNGGLPTSNDILLVSVLNARVQVTLENIAQIFRPYGEVLKIITFVKGGIFKALVQMGSVEAAVQAKHNLEGKDMFQGCCHLRIAFSKLATIKIKSNSSSSRDFTIDGGYNSYSSPNSTGGNNLYSTQRSTQQSLFGAGAGVGSGSSANGQGGTGALYPGNYNAAGGLTGNVNADGTSVLGRATNSSNNSNNVGMYNDAPIGVYPDYSGHVNERGCVLLVNNLDEKVTPDMLFTLFGIYGDVMRVKILFNKRDAAMVQFANPQQAYTAQLYLNHFHLFGSQLAITPSKYPEITLPRSDSDFDTLTKDYSNSPIHRFRNRNQRNAKNINPPSTVLHVSNIASTATEQDLRDLFGSLLSNNDPAPVVQFFTTNRRMAFVKMPTKHDAVLALLKVHNHKFDDKYLRVSFSHKNPEAVTDSEESSSTSSSPSSSSLSSSSPSSSSSSTTTSTSTSTSTPPLTSSPSANSSPTSGSDENDSKRNSNNISDVAANDVDNA